MSEKLIFSSALFKIFDESPSEPPITNAIFPLPETPRLSIFFANCGDVYFFPSIASAIRYIPSLMYFKRRSASLSFI